MTMPPKSIPAVKVPATTPLQQPRRFQTSFRGGRILPGAAATGYPAAAQPLLWQTPSETSSLRVFFRVPFGRLSQALSSLSTHVDSFIPTGRDTVHQPSSGSAFRGRFNRFVLNSAAVIALHRYQQKIYRVTVFGTCRTVTPEDVPA
jgi:hypothetical protein